MIIINENLSTSGFTVVPHIPSKGVLPTGGLDLCDSNLLHYSPAPKLIGKVSDVADFGMGPDINIGGLTIKSRASKVIAVPLELMHFYPVIKGCVDNEFACDNRAEDREFALTITRCNVKAHQSSRPHSAHWHRHTPSHRLDRAKNIYTTRNYVIADRGGTEFFVGHTSKITFSNPALPPTHILTPGDIGVFASPSAHRTPTLAQEGRRTVLIFISYAPKAEQSGSGSPLFHKPLSADTALGSHLLSQWRENEKSIVRMFAPIEPALTPCSQRLAPCC